MTITPTQAYETLRQLTTATDYTVNGKCSCCGECCSNFLPMTKTEVETIRKIIRQRGLKPSTRRIVLMADGYDATCPFLDDHNRCVIYDDRPFICQVYSCADPVETAIRSLGWYQERPRTVFVREEFFGGGT